MNTSALLFGLDSLRNRDFADVRTIMRGKALGMIGIGTGSGDNRAKEATMKAITSPFLGEITIGQAAGVLINIIYNKDIRLDEINEVCDTITKAAHPDATIFFEVVQDESIKDEIRVAVIAFKPNSQ